MKGYGMGQIDHMAERRKRLAARYPDRVPPDPTTHVVVDGELFVFGDQSVEIEDVVPDEPLPEDEQTETGSTKDGDGKKKGGRPKGSKNKAKD